MEPKTYTIEEALKHLPPKISKLALENRRIAHSEGWLDTHDVSSLSQAVKDAFSWRKTPEGYVYWARVVYALRRAEGFLAPTPQDVVKVAFAGGSNPTTPVNASQSEL